MAGLILIAVVLFAGKKQKTFAMQESGNGRSPGFVPELINTEPGEFAGYRRSDMKMADVDTDISDVDETDLGLDENAFDEMDMLTEEQAGLSFREVVSYIRNGDLQGLLDYSLETIQQTLTGEIKSNNRLLLQLLAVVILGSVFTNLSGKFGKMVGGNGFFVTYLMVVSILLGMFAVVSDIAVLGSLGSYGSDDHLYTCLYVGCLLYKWCRHGGIYLSDHGADHFPVREGDRSDRISAYQMQWRGRTCE